MPRTKNILIYHRFASLAPAGDCMLPLMLAAGRQRVLLAEIAGEGTMEARR